MLLPALFLSIVLAIWNLLCFHKNFNFLCFIPVKNAIDNLIAFVLNLYMHIVWSF